MWSALSTSMLRHAERGISMCMIWDNYRKDWITVPINLAIELVRGDTIRRFEYATVININVPKGR